MRSYSEIISEIERDNAPIMFLDRTPTSAGVQHIQSGISGVKLYVPNEAAAATFNALGHDVLMVAGRCYAASWDYTFPTAWMMFESVESYRSLADPVM